MEQKDSIKNEDTSTTPRRERYSCKTCNAQGCCAIYEYCVSCCLHPGKVVFRFLFSFFLNHITKDINENLLLTANKGKKGCTVRFT